MINVNDLSKPVSSPVGTVTMLPWLLTKVGLDEKLKLEALALHKKILELISVLFWNVAAVKLPELSLTEDMWSITNIVFKNI